MAVDDVPARQETWAELLAGPTTVVADTVRNELGLEKYQQVGQLLDELPEPRRGQVFHTLHPSLGRLLSQAWLDLRTRPYANRGKHPHPFRAPAHPELTRHSRGQWLHQVLRVTGQHEQPLEWFAARAGQLPEHGHDALGMLFGVAIDRGRRDIGRVLVDASGGGHPVVTALHVPVALFTCGVPSAWRVAELLLLSAPDERARGLMMRGASRAHPAALRRLLRLLRERDLLRFPSVIEAVGAWFGDARSPPTGDVLAHALACLESPSGRAAALGRSYPGDAFLALWATAVEDAPRARSQVVTMLREGSPRIRLAAVTLLRELALSPLPWYAAYAVADQDERLGAAAAKVVASAVTGEPLREDDGDEELVAVWCALADSSESYRRTPYGVWNPGQVELRPAEVVRDLWPAIRARPPEELAERVQQTGPQGRNEAVRLMAKEPDRYRAVLLALADDRSPAVFRAAAQGLARGPAPDPVESRTIEKLLRRRDGEARGDLIELLLRQPDQQAHESAQRLRAGGGAQAAAGEEILRALLSAGRATPGEAAPSSGAAAAPSVPPHPDAVIDHDSRTAGTLMPVLGDHDRWRPGVRTLVTSLAEWLASHGDREVPIWTPDHGARTPLKDLVRLRQPSAEAEWHHQREMSPLDELCEPWWRQVSGRLTDGGVELILAVPAMRALADARLSWWGIENFGRRNLPADVLQHLARAGDPYHLSTLARKPAGSVPADILTWLAVRELRPQWIVHQLDAAEAVLAAVPEQVRADIPRVVRASIGINMLTQQGFDWRVPAICGWVDFAQLLESLRPDLWSAEDRARLWRLSRYLDEPTGVYDPRRGGRHEPDLSHGEDRDQPDLPSRPARRCPPLWLTVRAVEQGSASHADARELLLGERVPEDHCGRALAQCTSRGRREQWLAAARPLLAELTEAACGLIIDAETGRGEQPTPYTRLVHGLRAVWGADTLVRLLRALGKEPLERGWNHSGVQRSQTLSHLVRVCHPAAGDSPAAFAAAVRTARLPARRLYEVALAAPQWAPFIQAALECDGLVDGVYWVLAHLEIALFTVPDEVATEWDTQTRNRSRVPPAELRAGAADAVWFHRFRAVLGDVRLDALLKATKVVTTGTRHRRPTLFADVLRGRVDQPDLLGRIDDKGDQDALRALPLLPLPAGRGARRAELSDRYQRIRQFHQESRWAGKQRRQTVQEAARTALVNLARVAGYPDAQRLAWAVEGAAVKGLTATPAVVTRNPVTFSLSVDRSGKPRFTMDDGGVRLRAVPSSLRYDSAVADLRGWEQELRQQAREVPSALEQAMVSGDRFTRDELADLLVHPFVAPVLQTLVLVTDNGHTGLSHEVDTDSPVGIAHPADLAAAGSLSGWRRTLEQRRIRQPFPQVLREVYRLDPEEGGGATSSQRFSGRLASLGLWEGLRRRGWAQAAAGQVRRAFPEQLLTAHLEVSAPLRTVDDVALVRAMWFTATGDEEPVALAAVPPAVFSEATRDMDLTID